MLDRAITKLDDYFQRNRLISRAAAIEELLLSKLEHDTGKIEEKDSIKLENSGTSGLNSSNFSVSPDKCEGKFSLF